MKCWASSLNNCDSSITREHYISDGLFNSKKVVVSGLKWCHGKSIEIGLPSAVAKILCKKHNNDLSDYDKEAKKLADFLERNIKNKPKKEDSIEVDGTKFEKWGLKTFFNLGVLGALDQKTHERLIPREEFVKYIYSNAPIPDGTGMYFVETKYPADCYGEYVTWNAVRNISGVSKIVGVLINIRGLDFVFNINPVEHDDDITYKHANGSKPRISYRPTQVVFDSKNAGNKSINFKWQA